MPDEVFGEPFVPPVSDGSGQDRTLLRKARATAAATPGFADQGRQAADCRTAKSFTIEFLLDEPSFQPHHAPFIKNLGTLGIEATLRLVDAVQYRARVRRFRFRHDHRALQHVGDAGRLACVRIFSSQAAATKGSYNLAGIADPVDRCADREDHRLPTTAPS